MLGPYINKLLSLGKKKDLHFKTLYNPAGQVTPKENYNESVKRKTYRYKIIILSCKILIEVDDIEISVLNEKLKTERLL